MSDQNLSAPTLEEPSLAPPQPVTERPASLDTTAETGAISSVNVFTQWGPVPDFAMWLALTCVLLAVAHHLFRQAVERNQSPQAAYVKWTSIFYMLTGVAGFIFLLPHTGENAAGLGDLVTKINWLWFVLGLVVVLGGCALSIFSSDTLHADRDTH